MRGETLRAIIYESPLTPLIMGDERTLSGGMEGILIKGDRIAPLNRGILIRRWEEYLLSGRTESILIMVGVLEKLSIGEI